MLNLEDVAHNPAGAAVVFFALLISHAVGDFALQGSFLSRAKNRNDTLSDVYPNGAPSGVWWNALFAHVLIHAGGVWLVTGMVVLAFAELVLHFVIDYAKCEGWISFATDQILHQACKLLYVILLFSGAGFVSWSPLG